LSARYIQKEARGGIWSRRMALFFLQLLVLAVLLHRFFSLSTPAAMNLLALSTLGLVLAILVAMGALVRIWFGGQRGATAAVAGIVIALIGLSLPGWFLAKFIMLPRLTDIETSPREPLDFKVLASMRPADANPIKDPNDTAAEKQEKAYPDIRPMDLERSSLEVFDMVNEAVKRLGWTIALSEPPGDNGVGRIEATDRTMIMGFTDDVLVGVTGDDAHASIDVRSVSRYGLHDFGANAARIHTLFAEVKSELEKGERTGLEIAGKKPDKQLKIGKRGKKGRKIIKRPTLPAAPKPPLLTPD
jgi:uncharacterized protein (DUF1499 family)